MSSEARVPEDARLRVQELRKDIEAGVDRLVDEIVTALLRDREATLTTAHEAAQVETDTEVRSAVERARAEIVAAGERANLTSSAGGEPPPAGVRTPGSGEAPAPTGARDAAATELSEETAAFVADAHVEERECDLACMDRLVGAVRALDACRSLSDILDGIAEQVAAMHIGRTAVFVVNDRALRGWKLDGFHPDVTDATTIDIPLDAGTVVAAAARTGEVTTTRGAEDSASLEQNSFAPLPQDRVGLALPLTVGGRTVAVLYADDMNGGQPSVPNAWPEALEILARHAARCLELVTIAKAYGLHVWGDEVSGSPEGRLSTSSGPGEPVEPREFGSPTSDAVHPSTSSGRTADGGGFAGDRGSEDPRYSEFEARHPSILQGGSEQGRGTTSSGRAAGEHYFFAGGRGSEDPRRGERAGNQTGAPAGPSRPTIEEENESAKRYARLLISEIKLYHEDAVTAGCRDRNLLERLGGEIASARRLYEQRVPPEVRERADYFGQELVRTLANGDPGALGLGS